MRKDPLATIKKLVSERYQKAAAVFWAGSVATNQGTEASDLDLVIVYEKLPQAFREAFIYEGWPIDAFIHDTETLRYFFEESRVNAGISGLINMVLNGKEITEISSFSEKIKREARQFLQEGPKVWDKEKIDKERFLITDTLEDIVYPKSQAEQLASTAWLLEALSQFYFRAANKWCASGKSIIRYLERDDPEFAHEFSQSFEKVFQTGDATLLKALTTKILEPYGGLLWAGYKSDAPVDAKRKESIALNQPATADQFYLEESINAEVQAVLIDGIKSYNESMNQHIYDLELSLLTSTIRKSTTELNRLLADNFIEFGSSGKIFNKNDILESLPFEESKKYSVKDFITTDLSAELVLATYELSVDRQNSLRASIWKFNGQHWQMLFHQGTNCPGA